MNILIAEDQYDASAQYKIVLEARNHNVVITHDGKDCLKVYYDALEQTKSKALDGPYFDSVVLDCRMKKDNIEVAKSIWRVNPHQRIILASVCENDIFIDSAGQLKQVVELLQKPFDLGVLVDTIEDKEIYDELEKLNVKVGKIRDANPTHEEIRDLLRGLQKIQNDTTF